ncbi:MAG: hypothetical protein ACUVT3_03990 [Ignavibacterium sp.]
MKNNRYDIEMLSVYLDGELSPNEKIYIEEKIKSSLELQRKLDELKKLKAITSEAKPDLKESYFFEERLIASLNSSDSKSEKIKKWIPAFTFTSLAAALIFVLSINPSFLMNIIEQQKGNLADFYKSNLKPLLYVANLTSEDIFNFALYEELPLDPFNTQIIKLSYDQSGKEFFEIRQNTEKKEQNNLKNFVAALELNESEQKQMDSILKVYSEKISAQVLVSDKNAIAINPNIWNLRKAVLADILSFARKHGNENFQRIAPVGNIPPFDKNIVWLEKVKTTSPKDFIICTPDTVFSAELNVDMSQLNNEMKKFAEEMKKTVVEENKQQLVFRFKNDSSLTELKDKFRSDKNFKVFVHNNGVQVHLQEINIPEVDLPNFDSVASIISEVTRNFTVASFGSPDLPENPESRNFVIKKERTFNTTLKNREVNIDSVIEENNKRIEINNKKRQSSNKIYNDSSANEVKTMVDSLIIKQNEELRRQIEQLRKEIEKFRQDLQNLNNRQKIEEYEKIIKLLEGQIEI